MIWITKLKFHGKVLVGLLLSSSVLAETKSFNCLIEANQLIEVRSSVPGLLESVPAKRGDAVKKGDVIVRLEASVEKSASNLAHFKAGMTGHIESWQAKAELSAKKYARRQRLAEGQAISIQEKEDAAVEKRSSWAELKRAREDKELARLEWQLAVDKLSRRTLRSPFDGVVVDRYILPGEVVDNSAQKPILKLAQVDPLRVEVILPVSLYGAIKVGDEVEIIPEQPVGGRYNVPVTLVDKIVDSASGTFGVRLVLANKPFKIPPGIKCTANFNITSSSL